jgi:hypothetical protein
MARKGGSIETIKTQKKIILGWLVLVPLDRYCTVHVYHVQVHILLSLNNLKVKKVKKGLLTFKKSTNLPVCTYHIRYILYHMCVYGYIYIYTTRYCTVYGTVHVYQQYRCTSTVK